MLTTLALCLLPQQLPDEQLVWTLPAEYQEEGFQGWVAPATLRFVAHAAAEGGTLVFVDGEAEKRAHAYVNPPAFSPNGKHVAWSFGDPSGRRAETWRVVADGKESKKLDWAGPVRIGDDGDAWAWVGDGVELSSEGWYEGGDYYVLEGRRKRSDEFSEAPRSTPVRMPNGRYAFLARDSKGYRVTHGKEEYGPFWWVTGFAVSADGERVVWAGIGGETRRDPLAGLGGGRGFGNRMRIRDGGEEEWGEGYRTVGAPALGGKGGEHLAFLARTEDGIVVVHDEQELPGEWDDVGTPVLSPDGSRVAYAANRGNRSATAGIPFLDPTWMDGGTVLPRNAFPGAEGRGGAGGEDPPEPGLGQAASVCFLVVDGVQVEGDWQRVVQPAWSADGSTVAVRVQSAEGWQVAVGEFVSDPFDEVGPPVLSEDGSRVGFAARKGRELWWKVVDLSAAREAAGDSGDSEGEETSGEAGEAD